ncbi:uncharacterized protein LOC115632502 [Scaptodrosophila lebanonensis]|uniref:Uncharacterized protein LOC115632502 n=1 Tax=Drosophila lebanonensis TaxID=7225 RepID=A0A6J2UAK1_DROLE|nr:uncharacterized protein LOC115632502 [Scaptodrosophila lebanonensis]
MSFFRNIRSSLASSRAKSSSRDSTPVRSSHSRPASVISAANSSRRDSTTSSRADSTLHRGDTFILNTSDEQHSNNSTLEKKSKKSKVFSKFSTFTKRKKTPSPEEVASYEHHPSDTATNTYYKWKSDGDRMLDYDAQADPFNFLYEQQSSLKALHSTEPSLRRGSSVGSNSSGSASASFDSSTYRKSKTPTHLREQLEQLKTHSNDDLLEQNDEEDEREKYKTVTLSSFRKSFRDRLLQQQKETPHNPAWFVQVEQPTAGKESKSDRRGESKENRPDFLVFENENYRPQSRSPLRDRPSRSMTRSPVKRNETFRVTAPSSLRRPSPSPTPMHGAAPSIRIEIKNSIAPHQPGRLVPVGVAKPMPTTEYYAQRLLANNQARHSQPSSASPTTKWYRTQHPHSPTRLGTGGSFQQQAPGRYQTLVQIGNEQSKTPVVLPSRGRAPTRVQLFGSKPPSGATYFGDHLPHQHPAQHPAVAQYQRPQYNAPAGRTLNIVKPASSNSRASSGGGPTIYLGRREQQSTKVPPRRNRSPIKIPWR